MEEMLMGGNAFRRTFLDVLDERTEPSSAGEADYDGPWTVLPCPRQGTEGFGVFRQHERPAEDRPEAWFRYREQALLAVAVLPSLARDPHYQIAADGEAGGFLVRQAGEPVGYFTTFNEALVQSMHVGECLLRSPTSLASLLLAAGTNAFRLLGSILMARLPDEIPGPTRDGPPVAPPGNAR
jgi:hypothetical protein